MPRHPIRGMAGSKPRLGDDDAPSDARKRFEENSRLDRIYKQKRNALLDLRHKREAMALGVEREQLISKELCIQQLSFLLVAARQKLLGMPRRIGERCRRKTSVG